MYKRIFPDKKSLVELEEKFSNWGDFTSCFFEGPLDINYEPVSGEPDWAMSEQYWPMLKHFLCSGSIQGVDDWIEDISLSEAKKFYKLNLHQFEGSLITNLLWGGCYGSPCETREQARKISSVLIDELYPNINSAPLIFSLVSEDWTGHSDLYAIDWTYIIRDGRNWWFLRFGSNS